MIFARRALLFALLTTLAACRQGDVRLDDHDVDPLAGSDLADGARCSLPGFVLRDARPSDVLASVDGQQLTYGGLARWTESALREASTTDASRQLEIELTRAYLEPHNMGHGVQFVLRVRERAGVPWRIYRGADSGTTWWGADAEFGQYVEDAARRAIRALIAAEAECARASSSARGRRR